MIDFTPVRNQEMKLSQFAKQFTAKDLRTATDESIDYLLGILDGLDDYDVTFIPEDPDAYDPHAPEGEQYQGWSLAHLVAHVTASSEENAAISSLLARGFPTSERPRYETPWRELVTAEQVRQRLEESRRMRLAYLDTWPDHPHLNVYRANISERFTAKFGRMNAVAAFLFGLMHETGHYEQFEDVRQQALTARQQQARQA